LGEAKEKKRKSMKEELAVESLPCLTFRNLSEIPGLVHGVFTRHGGVSHPPYESLNVSRSNGDSPEAVQENIARIKKATGLKRLVSSRQFHGDVINFIGKDTASNLEARPHGPVALPGDALATNMAGLGLVIKIADCQSVLLADPKSGVIANIHCGWRGSAQNIAGKTIEYLRERFGLNPARTFAAVSPSLGPCCAEFVNYRQEIPEELWSFQVRPQYFDFWAITREQLKAAGIPDANIEFSRKCTKCGKADFFSYRAEGKTGRMASVIGWRS
jgi:hypothetical protein